MRKGSRFPAAVVVLVLALACTFGADPAAAQAPAGPTPSLSPPTTAAASTAPTATSRGGGRVPGLVGLGGLVGVLGIGAFLFSRWRTEPARPLPAAPATLLAHAPTNVAMRELLEVSRRLTAAVSTGDIDRAVVRDALGLVPAAGAALIRRRGGQLEIGHESRPGLIVLDGLARGVIQRVAETGQPLAQVSATEPAIRNLPAAIAAVPLVGAGRVQTVLVVVRSDTRPFSTKERAVLDSLAPVAAAALATAEQARASTNRVRSR